MATSRTAFLIDELHRAFDGDPWHGPSFMTALAGVTQRQAQARPSADVHSIAEIVAHATSWTAEVAHRLGGHPAGDPEDGDWPIPSAIDEAGWAAMQLALANAVARTIEAIAGFPEARWDDRVGDAREASLGTGVTYAQTVSGLVQHFAYHGGQVAVLRKLAG
ncbi:DinB family protein [Luteitalea sp. TBR-22]|uniref:DinB family protein n=1 Tax=Luteitalea sp. TBR-22 TaxID=2802971 RepID=UPI001EF54EDA|nr:DinB family protein [Luteitalea sp. TBR-22]